MGRPLPSQLEWRRFLRVMTRLGYSLVREGPGSARHFVHSTREPRIISFHEPHNPRIIPAGTLRAYVRELNLSREEFLDLLD